MDAITQRDIRASFVNCSKGEAKRLPAPRDLADRPWEDLDFLGWTDPAYPGRGYIVVPRETGLVGIAMRFEPNGSGKSQMCTVCLTTHTRGGIALMSAGKVGDAGRAGNTLGTYMCIDLACSLYARGKKKPALGSRYREDLGPEEKIARVRENLHAFVDGLFH
ncbi:FBP domain-containing protein [Rhodococcus sp. NPDC058639]|uniref:FBP domain-containing protein n=1 Tax=Rhodococcus sp. NPDC058639 TaxID=3346570 RepID=UPI003661B6A3